MRFAALVALFVATPSFATPTELDKKTVASKAYVDTKQDKITTGLVEFDGEFMLPAITTYDSTSGLVANKIGILDHGTVMDSSEGYLHLYGDANSYGSEMDNFVPTVRAVAEALQHVWDHMPSPWTALTWDSAETTSTNAYDITFVGDTGATANAWPSADKTKLINTAALAKGLALKQNKITTGLVEFNNHIVLPAITTYDSTSGLVANKIGILDMQTIYDDEGDLSIYGLSIGYGSEMDNFVPTVRAVAKALLNRQEILSAAWTSTTSAVVMASTGGQTIDLTTSAGVVGRRYITAGGSQPLTKKSGADNVILYINGTKTLAQYQTSNFGGTGTVVENYIKGALVSLELLKDVYDVLNTKITNNALPTGTTGTVVTYNGTNATTGVQEFGETAIASAATYDANDQLSNGNSIANVTLVETKQTKRVCGGYEPGHENDPDYCWLWDFPD